MHKITSHINNARYVLMIWFVLFALSPCIVKEAFFDVVSVDYAIPLNKAKTITSSSCQYWQNNRQQLSIFKQSDINPERLPMGDLKKQFTVFQSLKTPGSYSKNLSGNSPPRYILYKRLKLDVA